MLTALPQSAEAGAIRSGTITSPSTLPRNDDDSTGLVPIGFNIDFFGVSANQLYVNNNGNVTFTGPLSSYTPFGLAGVTTQIIAPFFADVDTRNLGSSEVTYGTGTVDGRNAFTVNWDWDGVGYFGVNADKLNKFQLVMIDRSNTGTGNFDFEFNYDQIQWETGDASGGSGGLGGTSAAAGYSNGLTGINNVSFELPGSLVNGAFLDGGPNALISNRLNGPVLGRYNFFVRNGIVLQKVPEPASALGLLAIGALGTGSMLKQKLANAKKSDKNKADG